MLDHWMKRGLSRAERDLAQRLTWRRLLNGHITKEHAIQIKNDIERAKRIVAERKASILAIALCFCATFANAQFLQHRRTASRPPPAAGGGTLSFVGHTSGVEESDGSQDVARTITAGNLVVVAFKYEDSGSVPSISDTLGNTWTTVVRTNATANTYCGIAFAKNVTGGSDTITINFGGGLSHNFDVLEFSGASLTAPQDTFAHGSGSGTAASTFNMTTANASEALVCVISRYNAGTVTEQGSWTETYDTSALEVQYRITAVSGTYNGAGTISSSQIWAACVVAFK
jgi:hypothetical protein